MTNLPPGWAMTTLGEIALSVRNGIFVSRPGTQPNGVPILRISAVRPGQLQLDDLRYSGIDEAMLAGSDSLLNADDLLFTRYNGNIDLVGACALVRPGIGALTYPDKLIRVRVDVAAALPGYVSYVFASPQLRTQARAAARTTAGQVGISGSSLRTISIPLPPLREQQRIIAALDDHLSRLDAAEGELDAITRRVEHFRDQILLAVCAGWQGGGTAGVTAKPPPATGVNDGELPAIPASWRWVRLGEIADVVGGVTKDAKRQSDPSIPEYPYLRVANVQRGRLDLTNVSTIRVSDAKAAQLRLREGDVLLNEGGDRDKLGRGWIWEDQIDHCIHQNHVFRARIHNGKLHPKLLAWHANGFGKRWCEANGSQSVNLASISLSKIKLLPVPVPPAAEQASLVDSAEAHFSVLDRCELLIAQARANARRLRGSLLSEVFTGRLVPHDPTDEPAAVPLERIRRERAAQPKARRGRRTAAVPQEEALL